MIYSSGSTTWSKPCLVHDVYSMCSMIWTTAAPLQLQWSCGRCLSQIRATCRSQIHCSMVRRNQVQHGLTRGCYSAQDFESVQPEWSEWFWQVMFLKPGQLPFMNSQWWQWSNTAFAVICHDVAKPCCSHKVTKWTFPRWTFEGDPEGVERSVEARLTWKSRLWRAAIHREIPTVPNPNSSEFQTQNDTNISRTTWMYLKLQHWFLFPTHPLFTQILGYQTPIRLLMGLVPTKHLRWKDFEAPRSHSRLAVVRTTA